jgi:hypothetical protein
MLKSSQSRSSEVTSLIVRFSCELLLHTYRYYQSLKMSTVYQRSTNTSYKSCTNYLRRYKTDDRLCNRLTQHRGATLVDSYNFYRPAKYAYAIVTVNSLSNQLRQNFKFLFRFQTIFNNLPNHAKRIRLSKS